jgi:ribose 5-phosphate isomerase B
MNNKPKLALGSDHGGWELKEHLKHLLTEWNYEYLDMGSPNPESVDYPDYGRQVVEAVLNGRAERGILVCGTGIGMSIVANKYPGIRAALCHNEFTARMSREHNDANILVMGGRVIDQSTAAGILRIWLETGFAGDRHKRRLDKITQIEHQIGLAK